MIIKNHQLFRSDIDVDDAQLALALLDSRLDDEGHALLDTIASDLPTAEGKVIYSAIVEINGENEIHYESRSIAEATEAYINLAIGYHGDNANVLLVRFEPNDGEELYDLYQANRFDLLAAKYA